MALASIYVVDWTNYGFVGVSNWLAVIRRMVGNNVG